MSAMAYIIHEGDAFNVHPLSVKGVLQKLDNIISNSASRRESLGPREDLTSAEGGLLNGE